MNNKLKIYFCQIHRLLLANLKSRYRGSITGFFWVAGYPVLFFCAIGFVFHYVLRLDIYNFPIYLAFGVLPWIFISQSIEMSSSIFVSNSDLLKSFSINPLLLVALQVVDNFINFVFSAVIVLVPLFVFYKTSLANISMLSLALLLLVMFTFSISLLIATLNVFFRDTKFVVSFLLQVAFYMTPIFYSINMVPEQFKWMIVANPLYHIINPFQLISQNVNGIELWTSVINMGGFTIVVGLVSSILWRRSRNALCLEL